MKSFFGEQNILESEQGFSFKVQSAPPNIVFKGVSIEYNNPPLRRPRGGVKERARRALRESYLIATPTAEKEEKEKKEEKEEKEEKEKKELVYQLLKSIKEREGRTLNLALQEIRSWDSLKSYANPNSFIYTESQSQFISTELPRPAINNRKLSLNELEAKCKLSKLVWADEYSDTDD